MALRKLSPEKILNQYYYNRDREAFRECLLQLIAIIANSYLTIDEDMSSIRCSILEEDKKQERFR